MNRRFSLWLLLVWPACAGGAEPPYAEQLAALQERLAAQPTNTALLFQLGQLCHGEGGDGSAAAVKLAEQYLRELLRLDTNHVRALALLGSATTMKARDAFWPTTRLGHAREGIRIMDEAVARAPDDPHVRMTRAENNFHMPGYMGREKIAREDFAWLWALALKSPEKFTEDFRQKVALRHGQLLKRDRQEREAVEVWKKGIDINPGSPRAAEIQRSLARAGKA
jgi:tetratricopeptide (TPR) repeat protein